MDDQWDDDLSNHIREVFDNFEDPTADEGWLLLRKKFPEPEKKRPVAWLWWGSIAAGLLLFLGIGLWMVDKKDSPEAFTLKPVKQQQKHSAPADTGKLLAAKKAPVIKVSPGIENNSVSAATASQNNVASNYTSKAPVNKTAIGQSAGIAPGNVPPVYPHINIASAQQQPLSNGTNNTVAGTLPLKKADSTKTVIAKTQTPQYAVTAPAASAAASNTTVSTNSSIMRLQPTQTTKTPPANSMESLFASESTKTKKIDETTDKDKSVRFGVYAATFFNYAKGSNNQINAGAGFTSDIKLSKNLKLSTGMSLAQNTLNYNNSMPPTTAVANTRAYAAALTDNKTNSFTAASAFPVFKNYNANLVALDIPVNLKYEFNPQKTDTYISAGLSSGTFINESYTASYSYPGLAMAAGVPQQTTDETTRKSFNGFYFAKTLNVSFGVGYPMGKSNRLIVEPFLKYPLEGLGTQQIRFGAGGVNLKLNFTTHRK
jgi:hypothetical protein